MTASMIKKWWPSAIVLGAVLWLTLAPHPVPENDIVLFPGADKLVHALMMGGLTLTILFDMSRQGKWRFNRISIKPIIIVGIGVIIFSLADEWAQSAMRLGRTGDIFDFIADMTGVALACMAAKFASRRICS